MKINKEYVLRNIAGDKVIVPTGKAAERFNGLLTLNEVGGFIWEQVEKGKNREEIIELLLAEYEVEKDLAIKDVHGFLNMLKENEILWDDED